jgi:hypothetical protein
MTPARSPTAETLPRVVMADLQESLKPPAALIVAHPGHELLVHGWLERARPSVFVLTDGSGGMGIPRLNSTVRVLARAGAAPGAHFGDWSDRELYDHVLARRYGPFLRCCEVIAEALHGMAVRVIIADAAEGYNPAHDICRLLTNAVAMAVGGGVSNLRFSVVGAPSKLPATLQLWLTPAEFERKWDAVADYPAMNHEVMEAVRCRGRASFQVESFEPANLEMPESATHDPFYETFGTRRVAMGRYPHVIRYHEHLAPLAEMLRTWSERRAA